MATIYGDPGVSRNPLAQPESEVRLFSVITASNQGRMLKLVSETSESLDKHGCTGVLLGSQLSRLSEYRIIFVSQRSLAMLTAPLLKHLDISYPILQRCY